MAAETLSQTGGYPAKLPETQGWLRAGCKAVLKGIAKFPQLNGQEVEVVCWNEEKQRWKVLLPKGGDVNVFEANMEPAEMHPDEVQRLDSLLQEGCLFEAWKGLYNKAAAPQRLKTTLEEKLSEGNYSEIVAERVKLVELEGRGMGYSAVKPIQRGDVLLFDTAAASLKIPKSQGPEAPNISSSEDPWRRMTTQIRQEKDDAFIKEKILAIDVGFVAEGRSPIQAILERTTMESSREQGWMSLFPTAARFNHSCSPAAYVDSSRSFCVVRALRDISEGEEVCISYVPVSDSVTRRQEKLRTYGFECRCERCQWELVNDPEFMVPCQCGAVPFSLNPEGTRTYQVCEKCCTAFDREEARHHLCKLKEANRKVVDALRSGSDLAVEVKKLSALERYMRKGELNGIPPLHSEALYLLNHLAHLNYIIAQQGKGEDTAKALEAAVRYKKEAIGLFEQVHSTWTEQRDIDFIQVLHQFLKSEGLTPDDKQEYAKKLSNVCNLCFGQQDLPDALVPTR